jgi:hypothetical protein
MLRVGDTLVPSIFMSDGTHLSDTPGNNNKWAVYTTIGNLSSKIRQMPSTHSIVMVALLPIPIMHRNVPQKQIDEQWQPNRKVLNKVLRRVLHPLTFKQYPCAESGYYHGLCADGNFGRCNPVLVAWLADCPEYSDLHHVMWHVCCLCKCPKNELGDYVNPDKQQPRQDHNLYKTLSNTNTNPTDAQLTSRHVHRGINVF